MIQAGSDFAKKLQAPAVLELLGDVGSGKTTFTRGLAQGLGVKESVTSPSFTLSKEYAGTKYRLVHYDFYRLVDPGIMAENLAETISDKNAIVVVEWGQSIKNVLPENRRIIEIKYVNENTREVSIK